MERTGAEVRANRATLAHENTGLLTFVYAFALILLVLLVIGYIIIDF
jgi:hypothetical protein